MPNLTKLKKYKVDLQKYNVQNFNNPTDSYKHMLLNVEVKRFRHIEQLTMAIEHPITVIAGTNKVGKTSILLLIACSFEEFWKYDSTKPDTNFKKATWKDVISFTKKETDNGAYEYTLKWRVGKRISQGTGKRHSGARTSWTGLGKTSKTVRKNAKIKERNVRFIDLERLLPAREFSRRLNYKASIADKEPIADDVKEYFKYILEIPEDIHIYQTGSHINKRAFLIERDVNGIMEAYSSYNAASGEESLLNLLIDINNAPQDSLILIDELECGMHPNLQRRLADIIQYIAWSKKQQFIITTHSATLLSAFPPNSRKLIEINQEGVYNVVSRPAVNTVFSKMDCVAHPLVNLYCEDNITKRIIRNLLIKISEEKKDFDKLINIIISGPKNEVKNDYERHKRNFDQFHPKKGYCCVFDGDVFNENDYHVYRNESEYSFFLYPHCTPESFLISSYLARHPDQRLSSYMQFEDAHGVFEKMAELSLAADKNDAYSKCWECFMQTDDYNTLFSQFKTFIYKTITHFTEQVD